MRNAITTLFLTLAVLLGSAGVSISADLQKGAEAYNKKDYATALREWTPLAEKGNAIAQNYLGQMYQSGKGVKQNYKEAVKWFTLSAEQKHVIAQYNLGKMYDQGLGVEKDYDKALKLYRAAGFAR